MDVTIQFMNEGIKPSKHLVIQTVEAIDAIKADYVARGYHLSSRDNDPEIGAYVNLEVARKVADVTGPYYTLTGGRLNLQESPRQPYGQEGPYVSISAGLESTGEVTVYSPIKPSQNRPLTNHVIEKALALQKISPKLTLLISRFGRMAPGEIIDKAKRDVSRTEKKNRLSSLGFHIFGN